MTGLLKQFERRIPINSFSLIQIQLLPVWIIKKILSYLDKKTLETCKKVNEYWKYIIADYLKEIATRAKLDKEIENIEVEKQNLTTER